MDPNSIIGRVMAQVGGQQAPSPSFAPMRQMLNTYGRERWPTNMPPHEAGIERAGYLGDNYAQRVTNGTLDRVQQLQQLAQAYGPPPAEAQTYDQQMAYYQQVMAGGPR